MRIITYTPRALAYEHLRWFLATVTVSAMIGCAGGAKDTAPTRLGAIEARYAEEAARIQADPVAYLRALSRRCDDLEQYRLIFYRQERLGLFIPKLARQEKIRAAFRKEPFSVKFDWDDPESAYFESVYVAGQNDGKLIVRERKGVFPLPPTVREVPPDLPAKVGRAKNPITDFGLARMLQRSLQPIDDPRIAAEVTLSYRGLVRLEPMNRPAHHLEILRPVVGKWKHAKQDFYIDAQTGWPAGTDLWLENGQLDARYRYTALETDVALTDDDFRLRREHPASKPSP